MYGTMMGIMGALLPFTSRDDVDYFSDLEMHLRQDHPPLCGRDHMAYRSAYFLPVKDVIDGDLCEQIPILPLGEQRRNADEIDRTPGEIHKKFEEVRNKIIRGRISWKESKFRCEKAYQKAFVMSSLQDDGRNYMIPLILDRKSKTSTSPLCKLV